MPYCGNELGDQAKFCSGCGKAVGGETRPDTVAFVAETTQSCALKNKWSWDAEKEKVCPDRSCSGIGGMRRRGPCEYFCFPAKKLEALCAKADAAWADWRIQDAAREYYTALEYDPHCTNAYLGLSRIHEVFFDPADAIRIVQDGIAAGADKQALQARLDALVGPDLVPGLANAVPTFIAFSDGGSHVEFSRYSENGNLLHSSFLWRMSERIIFDSQQQLPEQEDILRPTHYKREMQDGAAQIETMIDYDAFGMVGRAETVSKEQDVISTTTTVNTTDSETGLPLRVSMTDKREWQDTSDSYTYTYTYEYTDGRLTQIGVTVSWDGASESYKFAYSFQYDDSIMIDVTATAPGGEVADQKLALYTDPQGHIIKSLRSGDTYGSETEFVYENGYLTAIRMTDGIQTQDITFMRGSGGKNQGGVGRRPADC